MQKSYRFTFAGACILVLASGELLLAADVQVNTQQEFVQQRPVVALAPEGQILVAWEKEAPLPNPVDSVEGRFYGADGEALGPQFRISDPNLVGYRPTVASLGGASFGFQAGADAAEVIILAMTERGVTRLLGPQVKLGGDISVAAGPAGGGASAGTAGLSADLVSFSMAKGLYGGFSVDGSVVGVRTSLNEAFYGKPVSPADIAIKGAAKNPQANALLEKVAQTAGGR